MTPRRLPGRVQRRHRVELDAGPAVAKQIVDGTDAEECGLSMLMGGAHEEDVAAGLLACPCCHQRTLEERAAFEICRECGWEDDGQDDEDAHVVRGGPNGSLSLMQARHDYLGVTAADPDESSVVHGGRGLWMAEALRQVPDFDE